MFTEIARDDFWTKFEVTSIRRVISVFTQPASVCHYLGVIVGRVVLRVLTSVSKVDYPHVQDVGVVRVPVDEHVSWVQIVVADAVRVKVCDAFRYFEYPLKCEIGKT